MHFTDLGQSYLFNPACPSMTVLMRRGPEQVQNATPSSNQRSQRIRMMIGLYLESALAAFQRATNFEETMFEKSRTHATSAATDELVSAFLSVRRALGLLGLSLPFLLYVYAQTAPKGEMQPSISEFYHTAVGDILVGILVAIGVFLIAYVGHKPMVGDKLTDWWVSTIAGIGAIGVALFPTLPPETDCKSFIPPDIVQGVVTHWCEGWGPIHFLSAGVFFVCMAVFCFRLFPKNKLGEVHYFDEAGNFTYFVCGWLLVISIVGLGAFFLIRDTDFGQVLDRANFVFWFEALGVFAFAIAWLTKGNLLGGVARLVTGRADKQGRG